MSIGHVLDAEGRYNFCPVCMCGREGKRKMIYFAAFFLYVLCAHLFQCIFSFIRGFLGCVLFLSVIFFPSTNPFCTSIVYSDNPASAEGENISYWKAYLEQQSSIIHLGLRCAVVDWGK